MVLLQPKYINKFKAEKEKYKDHEKNNHKYKKGIKLLNKNMYVLWCKLNGVIDPNVFPFWYLSIHVVIFEKKTFNHKNLLIIYSWYLNLSP